MPKGEWTGGRRGPLCKVCKHPEVARIELALASGRGAKGIADEFSTSSDSVQRHWQRHVSQARKAELICGPIQMDQLAKRAAEIDMSLLDWLAVLRAEGWSLYKEARERGLLIDASSILRTILGTLTKTGELTGQLRGSGLYVTNIAGNVNTIVSEGPSAIDPIKEQIRIATERIATERANGADALPAPAETEEAAE
jgi:hypothetical protein